MMTSVRLPENDYADHWVTKSDAGVDVGKGTIKVLKDTNSKDHALVTGSDGAANNTFLRVLSSSVASKLRSSKVQKALFRSGVLG